MSSIHTESNSFSINHLLGLSKNVVKDVQSKNLSNSRNAEIDSNVCRNFSENDEQDHFARGSRNPGVGLTSDAFSSTSGCNIDVDYVGKSENCITNRNNDKTSDSSSNGRDITCSSFGSNGELNVDIIDINNIRHWNKSNSHEDSLSSEINTKCDNRNNNINNSNKNSDTVFSSNNSINQMFDSKDIRACETMDDNDGLEQDQVDSQTLNLFCRETVMSKSQYASPLHSQIFFGTPYNDDVMINRNDIIDLSLTVLQSQLYKRKTFETWVETINSRLNDSDIRLTMTHGNLAMTHYPRYDSFHHVTCRLETDSIWRKFHELGTEMIVTKNGRRMYPPLRVSFQGVEPSSYYSVLVDIVPMDGVRYRYAYHSSGWIVAGPASPHRLSAPYAHPDGSFRGHYLQSGNTVCFDKLKMTNGQAVESCAHMIPLHSMHRYQPRIHLIQRSESVDTARLGSQFCKTFVFPQTSFIAVTAYQNHLVTKLKINSNPFAKGFRRSSN